MRKVSLLATAVTLMTASAAASATLINYTFAANGVTDSISQQATAVFTFDTANLGSFKVTLTDNVSPTQFVQSELTGLSFSFSQSPASFTLLSVSAPSVIDCTNSANPCPAGGGSSPYGWGATLNGSGLSFGAGFDGTSFAFQPYGIVNANYTSPGGAGGLGGAANNPLLVGPVTFEFATTNLRYVPEVNGVSFAFGDPDIRTAVRVPEPQSLALLGVGLLAGWLVRRQRQGAQA